MQVMGLLMFYTGGLHFKKARGMWHRQTGERFSGVVASAASCQTSVISWCGEGNPERRAAKDTRLLSCIPFKLKSHYVNPESSHNVQVLLSQSIYCLQL